MWNSKGLKPRLCTRAFRMLSQVSRQVPRYHSRQGKPAPRGAGLGRGVCKYIHRCWANCPPSLLTQSKIPALTSKFIGCQGTPFKNPSSPVQSTPIPIPALCTPSPFSPFLRDPPHCLCWPQVNLPVNTGVPVTPPGLERTQVSTEGERRASLCQHGQVNQTGVRRGGLGGHKGRGDSNTWQ